MTSIQDSAWAHPEQQPARRMPEMVVLFYVFTPQALVWMDMVHFEFELPKRKALSLSFYYLNNKN